MNPHSEKIRVTENRITATERKRRTRRLILLGSYIEHVTAADPEQSFEQPSNGQMVKTEPLRRSGALGSFDTATAQTCVTQSRNRVLPRNPDRSYNV